MITAPYVHRDVSGSLPLWWRRAVHDLVPLAHRVDREGAGPGSLTEDGLHFDVVLGDVIELHAPWLIDWFRGAGLVYAREMTHNEELQPSRHLYSAVNLNIVSGVGGTYEWHVDPIPGTAILYVDTLQEEDGGALLIEPDGVPYTRVPVKAGMFVTGFSDLPHAVEPLRSNVRRLSIPMAYVIGDEPDRDPDLDAHSLGR